MPSKKPKIVRVPTVTQTTQPIDPRVRIAGDGDFISLRGEIQRRFNLVPLSTPLFTVDATDLYLLFLDSLPSELRQHYDCRSCRNFVERFGGLATIAEDGAISSVLWTPHEVQAVYSDAVKSLHDTVTKSAVGGGFVSSDSVYGVPQCNGWDHLSVVPHRSRIHSSLVKSAQALAAERREDREMLRRGLEEFDVQVVQNALALAKSGGLTRPEKAESMLRWLADLHDRLAKTRDARKRENSLWLVAATAPAGFTHVKSSVVGSLLEDVRAGLNSATITRKWAEKLDPAQYLRAQVAPASGNLERAETIVAQMEASGSLRRRYALRSDVLETLWERREQLVESSGHVFGHIKPKTRALQSSALDLPEVVMSLEKFRRTVLTEASAIEYCVSAVPTQLAALVTSVEPASPPILQWDNGVSVYSQQAQPQRWNLTPGSWTHVNFVTAMPYHWRDSVAPQHKEGVLLALDGCRDVERRQGGGFLPEFLRSEFREIRSSLDAYARSATVEGRDTAEACGVALMKTTEVSTVKPRASATSTRVILVFDESGSMSSYEDRINQQAEVIRRRLAGSLPEASVEVCRFGSSSVWERATTASSLERIRLGSERGGTALCDALHEATSRAISFSTSSTLVYLFTDGEENQSRRVSRLDCQSVVKTALECDYVTFGCVGPRSASDFFASCGIPQACGRNWDGSHSDLDAVTQQVAQGIDSFADARRRGLSSIDDFFTAPVSGFGNGVRLRVTLPTGHRQIVILDRWD